MDSGNTNSTVAPAGYTITDPSSSLLNPTFFNNFQPPNPTNLNPVYDPIFNGFQNEDVCLDAQQPETSDRHPVGVSMKNPKKRTRASRRAPTTVLTTDTTNFRQMVQEFTGIPTEPFTRRLDVFGAGGRGSLYPVRPPLQNIQLPQQSFDINGFQKQPLMDSQNPIFGFQKQTLLGTATFDNQQLDAMCSSTINDQTNKGL